MIIKKLCSEFSVMLIVISLILSTCYISTSADGLTNLFPNVGFENTLDTSSVTASSVSKSYDSTYKHTGSYSLKVYQNGSWGSAYVNSPILKAGNTYSYSFWTMLDPARSGASNQKVYMLVEHAVATSAHKRQEVVKSLVVTSSDFVNISGTYTVPSDSGDTKFFIYSDGTGNIPVTFYLDDLVISELPSFTFNTANPANGSTGVSLLTNTINLAFSNEIDETSLAASIKVNDSTSLIQSVMVDTANRKNVIITLKSGLTSGTTYTVSMAGVKDIYGQALTAATTTFLTEGELVKPTVVRTYPLNNATNVPINTWFTVEFDMEIDLNTVIPGNIKVNGNIGLISDIQTSSSNKKVITVKLASLSPSTKYTISFDNIKSLSTAPLDSQSFTFTTAEEGRPINLFPNFSFENTLDTSSVTQSSSNVSLDSSYKRTGDYSVKVHQNISYGSMYIASPILKPGDTYSYSFWTRLDPARESAANQKIYMLVEHANSTTAHPKQESVKNILASSMDFINLTGTYTVPSDSGDTKFFIYSDGTGNIPVTFYIDDLEIAKYSSPTITAKSIPAPSSTYVPIVSDLKIEFSNDMVASSIVKERVKINGENSLIDSVSAMPGSLRAFNIKLKQPLNYSTEYSVTIESAKDIFDTVMPNLEYKFSTVPKFEFSNCKLLDSNSNEISKVSQGTVNVLISKLQSFDPEGFKLTLVACLFKDEVMVKSSINAASINGNSIYNGTIGVQMNVPDISYGEYVIRVFRIDSFKNLQLYYYEPLTYTE